MLALGANRGTKRPIEAHGPLAEAINIAIAFPLVASLGPSVKFGGCELRVGGHLQPLQLLG
jgi:hypothetical protein